MLSRIADSLFWLNRYMERADGLLRVMKTNFILSLDKGVNGSITWRPMLEVFTHYSEEKILELENDTENTLRLLINDTSNNNSLKVILTRARENARGVQDHITKEVWEQVNQMYHMVNQPDLISKLVGYGGWGTIEDFSKQSLLFAGVIDTTMPRGAGWSFMNLGKHIERCMQTIEIADKQYRSIEYNLQSNVDILQWRYLLLSLSGYELYLKTYHSNNFNKDVLQQVLMNEDFTRSVIYSLTRISRYLNDVVGSNRSEENEGVKRFFGRLYSNVKYVDINTLNGINLQNFIGNIRHDLSEFSKKLAQNFFSYS